MTDILTQLLNAVANDAAGLRRGDVVAMARAAAEEIAALRKAKGRAPKPEKKPNGTRGTRIPPDWMPDRLYARGRGLTESDIDTEAALFRNHWQAAAGAKGVKLSWEATWQTWCIRAAERRGRDPLPANGTPAPQGPSGFDAGTWKGIIARWNREHAWRPEYGPPPGRPGCRVPADILSASM